MKFPEGVSYNTYLTYKPPSKLERHRRIKSENFDWDVRIPKTLCEISIQKLSEDWNGTPKLEQLQPKDRELFLQYLDINTPLQILVDNVKSDNFWKRCYTSKWNDLPYIEPGKRWINIYLEKHFADIIENLNPKSYDPEKMNSLVKMCAPYINSLKITSLIPSEIPEQRNISPELAGLFARRRKSETKPSSELVRDHISLHAALGSLVYLVELHLTYQLKNTGMEYRKDQFQFSSNDAKNLARGLEKCCQLKVLRITRTDMNCSKVKYVLRGLSENHKMDTLDFSHCKLGDDGVAMVAKYISKREKLKNLLLIDNVFGPAGAESLSISLNNVGCGLKYLDLRLNNKLGSEGIAYIAVSLARGCNLICLNISGCGIRPGPLSKAPAGVWSTSSAENPPSCGDLLARAIGLAKTPLRSLDISVNDIGSPSDSALANAICLSHIIDINLKRSGMSSLSMAIGESAAAAARLRRDADRGVKFRRSASRLLQARRVARGMNIDADPILIAQQLSARPSIVSVTSEEGTYNIQPQPLPSDFGFVPAFKSPLPSTRASSITGPPTSRRSSHVIILEPVVEVRRSALVRRGSDGALAQRTNVNRHIKIYIDEPTDCYQY